MSIPINYKPKISVVIPCYTLTKELERLALWAAASVREQCDELIIAEDGGMYSPKLMELADKYLFYRDNRGFTKNVNRGWREAEGEYVMIMSSDTQLESGNIVDLCIAGKVTSPIIVNQHIERLAGPFWCAPEGVTKDSGYLREEMHTYSSDSEYDHRVADLFATIETVRVFHHMAQSVKVAGIEGGAQQALDRAAYQKLIDKGQAK